MRWRQSARRSRHRSRRCAVLLPWVSLVVAWTKVQGRRPYKDDASIFPLPRSYLRKVGEQLFVRVNSLWRALSGAQHFGQAFRQSTRLDFYGGAGNVHARGYGFAPQVDVRMAICLDDQNRHPLAGPHRCGIEQKLLIERELIDGGGEPSTQNDGERSTGNDLSLCVQLNDRHRCYSGTANSVSRRCRDIFNAG